MKKTILSFFVLLTTICSVFSQEFLKKDLEYVDTATFMIWATPKFAIQTPFGNGYLAKTFKFNYESGLDITFKTKSNWTIDLVFDYMFGSKLRGSPENFLGDMLFYPYSDTLPGAVYNGAGNNDVTLTYEGRYWYFGASVGKIIPLDRWKNSGLWFKMGAGYFGHKIHFTDPNSWFPQIDQEYRYGYDQRASAIALNQFIGYLFLQKRRVLSFYIGIEVWEIFSKPDRGYIFVGNLKGPTNILPRKFSGLLGIKLGWNLPFYEKKRVVTYYYY